MKKTEIKKAPILFTLSFLIFLSLFCLTLAASQNAALAERVDTLIAAPVRAALIRLSNLVRVSVFELIILSSPIWIYLLIAFVLRPEDKKTRDRRLLSVLSLILLFFSTYLLFAISGYSPKSREDISELSGEEMLSALESATDALIASKQNDTADLFEISERVGSAVRNLGVGAELPIPKPLMASKLSSRLGILAFYSFPTGEINVNLDAPREMLPFNIAHETAHAIGKREEDAANLFAFSALRDSIDPSLSYSAWLFAWDIIAAAVSESRPEDVKDLFLRLPTRAKVDILTAREFSKMNLGTPRLISEKINDSMISILDSRGSASYSYSANLIADHIRNARKECEYTD